MGGGENGDAAAAAAGAPELHERDSMLRSGDTDSDTKPGRGGAARRVLSRLGVPARWAAALAAALLLALLLLLVVIVMAASWPSPPPEVTSVRCETAHCLRAAAQLRSAVAADAGGGGAPQACSSIWELSCAAWLRQNPIPATHSQWSVTDQLVHQGERRLQSILSTLPQDRTSRSYIWKLDAFYQGCMERGAQPDISELKTNLMRIVNSLGGFDAVGSFERRVWDPRSVVRKLQAQHNIDVFFRIDVVADPQRGGNVIQICSGGVGLPERGFYFRRPDDPVVTAYQRYIQDVLLRVGATTHRAARFAENMYNYERRLAEAALDGQHLRDRRPRRLTVDWLRRESPQVDWLGTLRSVYPEAQVSLETEVLLPDSQYIIELSKIISSTASSSMNAYLMWRLIAGYHPYLVEADRAVLDILRSELTGVRQPPPHWLVCTRLCAEFFAPAMGALRARATPAADRLRRRAAVGALFHQLTQTLGGALSHSRFIGERSRAAAMQQISSLQLTAGYPDRLLDEQLLDSWYAQLDVQRHNFFDSVTAARRHQRTLQQSQYLAPSDDWELARRLNSGRVTYSATQRRLVVPGPLLQQPLFDAEFPPAFQYGGLGVRMAVAMLSSLEPASLSDLSSSHENDTVASAATTDHATMVHNQAAFGACVSAALAGAGVARPVVARVAPAASLHVLATRLALQALNDQLLETGEQQLPGLERMTAEQVFFIARGQSLCGQKREEKSHWDEHSTFNLDNRQLLELTVEQTASFRDVFHCNSTEAHVIQGPCGGLL